jgi:hypothetical protein
LLYRTKESQSSGLSILVTALVKLSFLFSTKFFILELDIFKEKAFNKFVSIALFAFFVRLEKLDNNSSKVK